MDDQRISALAKRTGFTPSTLRYYEQVGLLSSQRSPAGYRLYGQDAVARLRFIARAKQLGLPLDDIRELVGVWDDGTCAAVKARLSALVVAKSRDVRERIVEMTEFGAELESALTTLRSPAPSGPCDDNCGCGEPAVDSVAVTLGMPRPRHDVALEGAPISCTLPTGAQAEREAQWLALLALATARSPIAGGMRVTFPAMPGLAGRIAELAALEQQCCSFFSFSLDLSPSGVALDVRAPDHAAELVASVFGEATSKADEHRVARRGTPRRSTSAGATRS